MALTTIFGLRRFVLLLLLLFCTLSITASQEKPQLPMPVVELSEVSRLKAENLKLRTALAQCQIDKTDLTAQLLSKNLTLEQSTLEASLRKELGCKPTDKFDWINLKCEVK